MSKSYGSGPPAVDDLDLEIPDGSFTCLLGPSGCGKTTTLRMIAGLEHPNAGSIEVGDRVLDSVERGHLRPAGAARDGPGVPELRAVAPPDRRARTSSSACGSARYAAPNAPSAPLAALRMMQIDWAADRYPAQLSGGQQQRVSLARMLAVNPEVLLLDEPLSNLDAQLRLEMRAELKRIHDETGHTIVFVTHDQLEAMTMATHVVVMNKGVRAADRAAHGGLQPARQHLRGQVRRQPADEPRSPRTTTVTAVARRRLGEQGVPGLAGLATVGIRPEAIRLVDAADAGDRAARDWTFEATVSAVLPDRLELDGLGHRRRHRDVPGLQRGGTGRARQRPCAAPSQRPTCTCSTATEHACRTTPPAPNDKEKTAQWAS